MYVHVYRVKWVKATLNEKVWHIMPTTSKRRARLPRVRPLILAPTFIHGSYCTNTLDDAVHFGSCFTAIPLFFSLPLFWVYPFYSMHTRLKVCVGV